jgi:hypothetical protein
LDNIVACFDAVNPSTDGSFGNVKAIGGLHIAPTASRLENQDFEPLRRQELRSLLGILPGKAVVLDRHFLLEQMDFGSQMVMFDA